MTPEENFYSQEKFPLQCHEPVGETYDESV